MRPIAACLLLIVCATSAPAQLLLVGLEDTGSPMMSSDLAGFPAVAWSPLTVQSINAAAATPAGTVYLATGFFTSELYSYTPGGPVQHLCTTSVGIHGLGYCSGTLYGFANYATPMGIYAIDPVTGLCTLVVDTSQPGYRYFGLDSNPVDGLLYGYTEYGSPDGLHAINPATGAITPVAGSFPADNSMGRALAVGNNTVYVCATQGSIGVGLQAWNLGTNGPWTSFTQPYPDFSANGGATWVPPPTPTCQVVPTELDFGEVLPDTPITQTFTITNTGQGTLSGTVTEDCTAFSVLSGADYSLDAGESQTVSVRFQSAEAGVFTCVLATGGDCNPVACAAAVSLAPACLVSPGELAFGSMPAGTISMMTFTITNTGQGTLSGNVSGGEAGFRVAAGAQYQLAAGESQEVQVEFTAGLPGEFSCLLDTGGSCADVTCSASVPVSGQLFVGLEEPTLAPVSSDLTGFPDLAWTPHTPFDVAGAAGTPDGTLYVCQGPFTTQLHRYPLDGAPQFLCTTSVAIHGLGWVDGTLYGFANFAGPMGLYTVDTVTGQCDLALDLSASGYRFFALDGNPEDGLLYGYTEYGAQTGLYAIDPVGGQMTFVTGPIPADNSSARAMAVGSGRVFLAATRGDDGVPLFAWDLMAGGPWTPFEQPFPNHHSSGGAAFVAQPAPSCEISPTTLDFGACLPGTPRTRTFTITNTGEGNLTGTVTEDCPAFSVVAGSFYNLGAGESHMVSVRFQAPTPGDYTCDLDTGACGALPCRGAAAGVLVLTGPASACGQVEDLGQDPGAATGFVPDWQGGLLGLQVSPTGIDPTGLSVSIWIDNVQAWTAPLTSAHWVAAAAGFDLSDWFDQDVQLHFEVTDGTATWNDNGAICHWDLEFLDLDASPHPGDFRLLEPAPNPFNPLVRLGLELPQAQRLTVTVTDLAGRTVALLHEGPLAAGRHQLSWAPQGLASGLYFVVAQGSGRRDIKRLLYIR